MVTKVLIATDGSDHSDFAFEWYCRFLHRDSDCVYLVFVTDYAPIPTTTLISGNEKMIKDELRSYKEQCDKKQKHIKDLATRRNIKYTFKHLEGNPGETIVKAACEHEADFVIVGSRGQGAIRRTILGSVSEYTLHHLHIPVLICKHDDEKLHESTEKLGKRKRSGTEKEAKKEKLC